MAKLPVTLGCAVVLTPGAAGPPDSGVIVMIPQQFVTANGMPLAVAGSMCQMVNSLSGAPYPLSIGSVGVSGSLMINNQGLVRMGDQIIAGAGVLSILGPPATPAFTDGGPP
ncbi:hypothetical protein SAMN05660964_01437 [Thiothrix caldifontis]|uniref:Zn-binding Pro-Ala-Ala-Arg (PAAR) domain-containing protein, incolved in TypeVI secretion n=1 Tax=Thiothrix caldifontis TaxID=525918 RepID=A0A1H4AP79_9GAMM|nr:hypothetical protein [Thiothrix caldifontis]SEA37537.1 hypothetical protein SAMN05660964_01437 [Thiothrix caldifontis]